MCESNPAIDGLERYRNLFQPAMLPRPEPSGLELDDEGMDRLAQLLAPAWAALHAAGVCAELLALAAGITPKALKQVLSSTFDCDEFPAGLLHKDSSPDEVLRELLLLHRVVATDISDLAGEVARTTMS